MSSMVFSQIPNIVLNKINPELLRSAKQFYPDDEVSSSLKTNPTSNKKSSELKAISKSTNKNLSTTRLSEEINTIVELPPALSQTTKKSTKKTVRFDETEVIKTANRFEDAIIQTTSIEKCNKSTQTIESMSPKLGFCDCQRKQNAISQLETCNTVRLCKRGSPALKIGLCIPKGKKRKVVYPGTE